MKKSILFSLLLSTATLTAPIYAVGEINQRENIKPKQNPTELTAEEKKRLLSIINDEKKI